jgi:hypothetical protein
MIRVEEQEVRLLVPVQADRPQYLVRKNGSGEVGTRLDDEETIRQFFREIASESDLPTASPSESGAYFVIHWQSGHETTVRYSPRSVSSPAALTFNKSLLTASCSDGESLITRSLSEAFAKRLEAGLNLSMGTKAEVPDAPMTTAQCTALLPVK